MNRSLIVAFMALSLFGCKPSDSQIIGISKKEISLDLKDPDSAQFRYVRLVKKGKTNDNKIHAIVCGQINARNGFGAYVGFKKFMVLVSADSALFFFEPENYLVEFSRIFIDDSDSEYFDYTKLCGVDK